MLDEKKLAKILRKHSDASYRSRRYSEGCSCGCSPRQDIENTLDAIADLLDAPAKSNED